MAKKKLLPARMNRRDLTPLLQAHVRRQFEELADNITRNLRRGNKDVVPAFIAACHAVEDLAFKVMVCRDLGIPPDELTEEIIEKALKVISFQEKKDRVERRASEILKGHRQHPDSSLELDHLYPNILPPTPDRSA